MDDRRNIIKIANIIQQALIKLRNDRYLELLDRLTGFSGQFQQVTAESRKMSASLMHDWFFAAHRCCNSISRMLHDIPYSVSRIQQLTEGPRKEVPKLLLLVGELNQLQQEFGKVDFDNAENTISVVTEPITLEDIYLGAFRIQLDLTELGELYKNSSYHVVALDPHPAATADEVTHPHISNERLCEGDGSVAIRSALEQGRLCDFFTLVKGILNTYNPDSPYVSLSDWDGTACYDCGYVMSSEDSCYCYQCERDICSECSTYYQCCEETVCLGCAGQCQVCDEPICSNCARICADCGKLCCDRCMEDDLCVDCEKLMEAENEEQQKTENNKDKDKNEFQAKKG